MNNEYIEAYKHLIGCEFVFPKQKGMWIVDAWYHKGFGAVCLEDNAGYVFVLNIKDLKLYLDEDTLGTYEEYMELHCKEYLL